MRSAKDLCTRTLHAMPLSCSWSSPRVVVVLYIDRMRDFELHFYTQFRLTCVRRRHRFWQYHYQFSRLGLRWIVTFAAGSHSQSLSNGKLRNDTRPVHLMMPHHSLRYQQSSACLWITPKLSVACNCGHFDDDFDDHDSPNPNPTTDQLHAWCLLFLRRASFTTTCTGIRLHVGAYETALACWFLVLAIHSDRTDQSSHSSRYVSSSLRTCAAVSQVSRRSR